MLQAVGVLTVAAISGAAAGLNVGGVPGFRTDGAQEGGRVESAGTHFHVQGLEDDAAVLRPEVLQGEDQALEGFDVRRVCGSCLVCHDVCLLVSLCVAPGHLAGALRKKGALYACQSRISKLGSED